MRILLAILALSATAYADARHDVEALVGDEVTKTAAHTDDAVVVTPHPVDFYMKWADKIEGKVDNLAHRFRYWANHRLVPR